jgi:predicted ABC-type ATPase
VRPVLLVIAGPNGAGKTTVTVQLRKDRWSDGAEYLFSTPDISEAIEHLPRHADFVDLR